VPAVEHVALVIGNADYKEAPLRNPLNDVHDVARVLRALRFEVFEVTNINRRKMIETVNDFGTRLQQAAAREIARQLARHVAKLLTGVKAGDLPIECPMKLELVINLKFAKQIGVTIPSEVLMQANKLLR